MDKAAERITGFLRGRGIPAAAALFLFFFALYSLTRDHAYAFDSLLTALSIRRPLFSGPAAALLSWNHFLWLPLCRCFFLAQQAAGLGLDVYESSQLLNALAGGLLLVLIYRFLTRRIHPGWALAAACLTGFTHAAWLRSTSGDPYLVGTLLGAAACTLLTPLPAKPGLIRLFTLAALLVLSGYMHVANLALLPAAALAAARGRGRQGLADAAWLCFFAAMLLLPYAFFYNLFTPRGFMEWLAWGSGGINGQAPGASASGQFNLNLPRNIPVVFTTLLLSFIEIPGWAGRSPWPLALPAAVACTWVLAERKRRALCLGPAFTPLLFFAAITGLFSLWMPGNIFYWAGPLVFFVLTLALVFSPRLEHRPAAPAALAAAAVITVLAACNLNSVIRPNMAGEENKRSILFCRTAEAATPSGSVLLISGYGDGYLKVGLPYFAGRRTFSLDLLFIQYHGTGLDPLAELRSRIDTCLNYGVPVFALGDVLLAGDQFATWGIPSARIGAFLDSYKLTPSARLSEEPHGQLYRLEKQSAAASRSSPAVK